MPRTKAVTIVIPIYADWESLSDCIDSLIETIDFGRHRALLVNDNGPEADRLERNIHKKIKGHKGLKYFRNSKNIGFVKTCNRAVFELDRTKNDILLLNSDTVATTGFLEEMQQVLNLKRELGAVSPRSNNATIATIPLSAAPNKGLEPEKSYELFLQMKQKLPRYNPVPTAHGFCMLIRRSLIQKYGLFDEAFDRGYGEEVDFCQRLLKRGYLSVLANRAYVFHLEARSFSLKKKAALIKKNSRIINRRYPDYEMQVRNYTKQALDREEGKRRLYAKIRARIKGLSAR